MTFSSTAVASARSEAFVATAAPRGPVLLANQAGGRAATLAPAATLTADGDGDVLLAAAGARVVAGYQRRDRMRLEIVR